MRIENLSIRFITVLIISMVGLVAIVLSFLAGNYFRQAALESQINSLSRVIEVASSEAVKAMRAYTFDLGMRLGNSTEIVKSVKQCAVNCKADELATLLDDPFVNGFVGFSNVNLEKIRIYDLSFNLLAQSNRGIQVLTHDMPHEMHRLIQDRKGIDRLKSLDVLWLSAAGPMNSTLVPVGGLHLVGYLEIVVNPVFNLLDVSNITKAPVDIFDMNGQKLNRNIQTIGEGYLPVEYIMTVTDGHAAFRIVGYEDVAHMNQEMRTTQIVVTIGFLLLTMSSLIFSLWLFNRFLFVPMRQMILDMKQMAQGRLDVQINKNGLRDFSMLAQAFDAMASQIKQRTNDLEQLLDLDDSAILCFGHDYMAVYMNNSACALLGYSSDEMADLEMSDLFDSDAVKKIISHAGMNSVTVQCVRKDGNGFDADVKITLLDSGAGNAYAMVLTPLRDAVVDLIKEPVAEQRMTAIEHTLSSLLEIARNNPGLVAGLANIEQVEDTQQANADKSIVRQQAVQVMTSALACWQHDLGKTKLALAEESRIWPVYIDKSTPTTRTLDKYLNIDSCPKNPRYQRVIETAEFVLRKCRDQSTPYHQKLHEALQVFREIIAGS